MVAVLKQKKRALELQAIVDEIIKSHPTAFRGQTPRNSLYSIIYRRETRRAKDGQPPRFLTQKVGNQVLYSLNPQLRHDQ